MFDILKYPNRRKTFTAYIIFGAISLVFVFMGMETGNNSLGGHAAIVNDTIISPKEYEMTYNNLSRFYGNMFGGNNNQFGGQGFLRQMALNQLVNQTIVNEYSGEIGVEVTDEELRNYIINIPAFQDQGRFQKEYYKNYLKSQSLSSYGFEKQLRREIAFQKVRSVFSDAVFPSSSELGKEKALLSESREAKFIKWDAASLGSAAPIKDSAIKSWLKKNMDQAKADYEKRKDDFKTEAQVKARHILLKTSGKTGDQKEAVKAKMLELKKTLTADNFAEMAKKHSEDTGSKVKGGDLGFFGKGQMVAPFEKAAFATEKGQITDLVESQFGYHVILVEDKKDAGTQSFDEVKNEIARTMMETKRKDEFEAGIEAARASIKSLNRFAKKYKLKWEKTGALNASTEYIKGLGRSPEALDVVFQMDKGGISKVVQSGATKLVMVLESVKKKDAKQDDKSLRQKIVSKYSQGLMTEWTKGLEAKAEIQRNERYINR